MTGRVHAGLFAQLAFLSMLACSQTPEDSMTHRAAERTIQLPIELRNNFPFLAATVDGIDVTLKFDLGDGSAMALQQGVLDRIKAIPTGKSARFQSAYGVFELPLFKVARVQIGSLVFTDVTVRLDGSSPSYEPGGSGEQGYLGTGLLKSHRVVIDYLRRTLKLSSAGDDPDLSGDCVGTALPFVTKWRGEPVTEAETDLGRVVMWWDTGSPISILRKSLVQGAKARSTEQAVTTQRLRLGGREFGPWQFDLWDVDLPGFDGILGFDFFARHVVCVDFPGNRLVIGR